MCHTHEAIHSIAKMTEKDKITVWVDGVEIHGTIHCCDESNKCQCLDDILTLKETCVHCDGEKKHYKWLNIPSHAIKGFTFECCCNK